MQQSFSEIHKKILSRKAHPLRKKPQSSENYRFSRNDLDCTPRASSKKISEYGRALADGNNESSFNKIQTLKNFNGYNYNQGAHINSASSLSPSNQQTIK